MTGLPKYLTQVEVRKFFQAIDSPRDHFLFGLIYKYGLRVGEACNLRREDLDLTRKEVRVKRLKGGIPRTYPLPADIVEKAREYLDTNPDFSDGQLFQGLKGGLKKRMVELLYQDYCAKAGITSTGPHALRHSIAVHLLDATHNDLVQVKNHLGHKNINSTAIYVEASRLSKQQTLEALNSEEVVRI